MCQGSADSDGESLFIVYDFSESGLSPAHQNRIVEGVRNVLIKAGVKNVQSFFAGGSVKPKVNKKSDRIVHVTITSAAVKSKSGNPVYGRTSRYPGNRPTVSTVLAPSGTDAMMNFLINVTAHEVGHGSQALPMYSGDGFPPNTPMNSVLAESGTTMEQGASRDDLGREVRSFSDKDEERLRQKLNEEGIEDE